MCAETNLDEQKKKYCPACKRQSDAAEIVCKHDGTILMPIVQDNFVNTVLADKYEILTEIGRGGMSIVYKARHQLMDRTVAVKMLQSQLLEDQINAKRFQQEARAASCLAHPNVVAVHDFGIAETGQPYLVMDLLIGKSLADIIKCDNHVEPIRALNIFKQTCDALEHAHKKGVIHRDLKSSNIMLVEEEGKQEVVKVVDFGIAKFMPSSGKQSQNLTQTGEVFGSPIYMSPEQCLGNVLDARSDVYSMGVVLYEALTGMPPLMGDTIIDTMQMHVTTPPKRLSEIRSDLSLPIHLEKLVLKALAKSPDKRYQSMQEFADAIEMTRWILSGNKPDPDKEPIKKSEDPSISQSHILNADSSFQSQPAQPQASPTNFREELASAGILQELEPTQPMTLEANLDLSLEADPDIARKFEVTAEKARGVHNLRSTFKDNSDFTMAKAIRGLFASKSSMIGIFFLTIAAVMLCMLIFSHFHH